MKVAVARETAPDERRVALVPETSGSSRAGLEVLVERDAGAGSAIPDSAYTEAGATVVSADELYAQADVVLRVQKPSADEVAALASRPDASSGCSSRSSTPRLHRRAGRRAA